VSTQQQPQHYSGLKAKLVGAWLFVGIPLTYGVVMTVRKAVPLFTG
jgi:hypothetical protein